MTANVPGMELISGCAAYIIRAGMSRAFCLAVGIMIGGRYSMQRRMTRARVGITPTPTSGRCVHERY